MLPVRRSVKVLQMMITAGVSASAISQITAVRPVRVMTSQKKKHLRSYSVLRTMVSYIRSPISMAKIRSLVSVTVT